MWTKFDLKGRASVSAVSERLRDYYKIMTTREPLERLVSAYRDKLETNRNRHYRAVSAKIHKAASKRICHQTGMSEFLNAGKVHTKM